MKLFRIWLFVLLGFSVLACQDGPAEKTMQEPESISADIPTESPYKGLEEKILSRLVGNEIPEDFPTFEDGETKDQYRVRSIMWAKENLEMIKPEYRKKVADFRTK